MRPYHRASIRATLTEGMEGNLTLRVFMTQEERERFLLEKGVQPTSLIEVVVVPLSIPSKEVTE